MIPEVPKLTAFIKKTPHPALRNPHSPLPLIRAPKNTIFTPFVAVIAQASFDIGTQRVAQSVESAGWREDYSILGALAGEKIARSRGGTSGRESVSILKLVGGMRWMDGRN